MTRRRRLIGFVVAGLLLVFLGIEISPESSGGRIPDGFSDAPFGSFAGYAWVGGVHSVGASFTVPPINRASPLSEASTWIGAQGQGPPARFVQIGAIEGRLFSPQKHKTVDAYYAFWSDTARHYKAKVLFAVSPGDTLSASLTLAGKHWALAITDNTSQREARFSIGDEVEAPFTQAEWAQEDPGRPNNHARYPQMAAPVFQHLTVNSNKPAPAYSALHSEWMSVNHGTLAPTIVREDSFTLAPAPELSAAATQYLRLTAAADYAFQKFEDERSSWTSNTPYAQIANACLHLIQVTQKTSRAMRATRWTKQISELMRSSAHASTAFLERLRPPAVLTPATFATWNSRLTEASQRSATLGGRLRLALGLPGFGPEGQAEHG
jgi:hypothetical protein